MMIITQYLLRQILGATFMTTGVFVIVIWLIQSLRFIDYITTRNFPIEKFFVLITLTLPSLLGLVMPIALFGAGLFVLTKMTDERELIPMQSAGASPQQLARPLLATAFVLTILQYINSLYIQPATYRIFKDWQNELRHLYSTIILREGVFNTIGPGITVFLHERDNNGKLHGLLVHDTRDPKHQITLISKTGFMAQTPEGPRIILRGGHRYDLDPSGGDPRILTFEEHVTDLVFNQEKADTRWREPSERYLHELFIDNSGPETPQQRAAMKAEGHQRLAGPLHVMALASIAAAFLLVGEFQRKSMTRRVTLAIITAAVTQFGGITIRGVTATTPAIAPLMYALPLGVATIGLIFLTRQPITAWRRSSLRAWSSS